MTKIYIYFPFLEDPILRIYMTVIGFLGVFDIYLMMMHLTLYQGPTPWVLHLFIPIFICLNFLRVDVWKIDSEKKYKVHYNLFGKTIYSALATSIRYQKSIKSHYAHFYNGSKRVPINIEQPNKQRLLGLLPPEFQKMED